jgi:hypothetical protein
VQVCADAHTEVHVCASAHTCLHVDPLDGGSLTDKILRGWGDGLITHSFLDSYSFVDDTDIIQSNQPGEPFQVLATRMKSPMDTCEGELWATGGALEPEKSFWYVIRFCWKNEMWFYVSNEDTPASISVHNHAGNRVEIECLEATEARKTLEFKTAPTGDNTVQFEHMLEASQKWAAHIKAGNPSQMDDWLALRSTIWKTGVSPYMKDTEREAM